MTPKHLKNFRCAGLRGGASHPAVTLRLQIATLTATIMHAWFRPPVDVQGPCGLCIGGCRGSGLQAALGRELKMGEMYSQQPRRSGCTWMNGTRPPRLPLFSCSSSSSSSSSSTVVVAPLIGVLAALQLATAATSVSSKLATLLDTGRTLSRYGKNLIRALLC